MNRRSFAALLMGLFQLGPRTIEKPRKKFYITGLRHTEKWNDCTIPPIVAYGTDRLDALERCCEEGGLTVWTEQEWKDWRVRGGKNFDGACKQQYGLDPAK